jgi:hypothetical protein
MNTGLLPNEMWQCLSHSSGVLEKIKMILSSFNLSATTHSRPDNRSTIETCYSQ